jgi:hypothetical protein
VITRTAAAIIFSVAATGAAGGVSSTVDTLEITTRPFSAGTNLARAEVETRKLMKGDALAERVRLAIASLNCPSGPTDVEVEPLTVRDYIGDTTARLAGVGLYVSMQPTAERSTVDSYIYPYMSVRVRITAPGKAVDSFEIWEFERIPLNRSTNLDFVREKPAAVESAILSFAQKTLEMHFRRRVESICSPRASRDPQVG